MNDVKHAADEYNKIAEQSAKAGLQQGLHNENFEMSSVDGKRTYDLLFELLDPKLVKFQFQVSTISQGLLRCSSVFHYLSRPLHFFARAGLVGQNQKNYRYRAGHARLEEHFQHGENRRYPELLCGDGS
jgi:hypothetical protein